MTQQIAKEKAKELIDKIHFEISCELADGYNSSEVFKVVKRIALITIDEILPIVQNYEEALSPSQTSDEYEYWQEVKKEIEKL